MVQRFAVVVACFVAVGLLVPATAANAKTDSAKKGCLSAVAAYDADGPTLAAEHYLSTFGKVKDKKLQRIVASIERDDTRQDSLDRLERWCAARYPKVKAIREASLIARTRTLPPITTTLGGVQPQHYEGTGDSRVDVAPPIDKPAIAHIIGNGASGRFTVTSYGPTNNLQERLVNTTDAYDGVRFLPAVAASLAVARFEVKASSAWSIDIAPAETARVVQSPGHVEGESDDVIRASGNPTRAHIVGNAGGRTFQVISYGPSRYPLVNTTDPYDDTVAIQSTANALFEIKSDGQHWSIDFS
jgi:hypothetical protein